MGVMLQAFYWDCPGAENREHKWWTFIKSRLPAIAEAGFTALWLPASEQSRWDGNRWATIPMTSMTWVSSIRKAACLRGSVPKQNCST